MNCVLATESTVRPSPSLSASVSPDACATDGLAVDPYHADITECSGGRFKVTARGFDLEIVSSDPEHDFCLALVRRGLPDGPIQFWRGETPSISFKSVLRASAQQISRGNEFPRLRKRRDFGGSAQSWDDAA